MEKVRKVVKKYYLRQIITYWLACWMFFGLPAQVAMAAMNAGNIVSTSQTTGVDFLNPSGSDITTVIAPHQAIIEYSDFNVDALKTLHFDQALATDAVLNRIIEDSPQSNIYGNITALGRVFIVNPAGIVFGSTATVNVAQLVASGLGMSDGAFQAVLADVDNKMEFTGGSGKVENWGTINATDSVYLIGKTVRNHGSILCPDGLVVMAAGNEVKLRQPGSTVIVDMTIDYTGDTDNDINHTGGKIEAKNIALAAGDIWSSALIETETLRAEAKGYVKVDDIINAHDTASSDAVATIDIIAGGNVTVNAEIKAEAVADGVDNATATLTINADGDVDISGNVHTYAFTKDGSGNNNATAKTTVTAANVTIDDGQIGSDAYVENGSGNSTANVDIITTDSDVKVINDSWIWSYAEADGDSGESTSKITIDADNVTVENFSGIYAETEAYDGSGNTLATVDIDADGDVLVKAGADGQSYITSDAYSDDAGDTTATVDIYATGNVLVNASVVDKLSYIGSEASSYEADNAKAETIVDVGGSVIVTGSGGTGRVYAWAHDGLSKNTANVTVTAKRDTVDPDVEDGHVSVKASNGGDAIIKARADSGTVNSATTTIITDGGVLVQSDWDNNSDARIRAEAENASVSNTAIINMTALEDIIVTSDSSTAEIYAMAQFAIDDPDNNNNKAEINITARSVEVKTQHDAAEITAYTYDGFTNTSNVTITAKGTEIIEDDVVVGTEGGDVKVKSDPGDGNPGYAGIRAVAEDGPTNTTNVKIDAAGDVEVIARNGGEAEIIAEAFNSLYIGEEDDIAYSKLINTAGVDIDADGRVKVKAEGGTYEYPSPEWIGSYAAITAKARNIFDIERDSSEPVNLTLNGLTNEATVDIDAAKVEVLSYSGAEAEILAEAANILDWDFDEDGPLPEGVTINLTGDNINNTALVDIATLAVEDDEQNNGNVLVKADGGDYAGIRADAFNGILELADPETADDLPQNMTNLADVTIDADGEVKVAGYYGEAAVTAFAALGRNNEATVDITADDDLKVEGYYGEGSIEAIADSGVDNTANIVVNVVGGDVKVTDEGGIGDTAKIEAKAQYALNSNNADVQISATATTTTYEREGDGGVVEVEEVNGGNIKVVAKDGGHAEITAFAADAEAEMDLTSNTANVTIRTNSAEGTTWEQVDQPLSTLGDTPSDEPVEYEKVLYTEGGDVKVKVENGGKAAIQSVTMRANENDSDVLICAEGEVVVSDKNSQFTTAKITSVAHFGNINNAYTGVRGAEGITVLADGGNASIASKAMFGLDCMLLAELNNAFTSLCTDGDVLVIGLNNGTAEVLSKAIEGIGNTAETGVCADGDILVAAGLDGMGGTAKIKSEARAAYVYVAPTTEPTGGTTSAPQEPQEPTSATANTTVVSHKGGVGVIDMGGPNTALIEAKAHNSNENNAYVGVAAGADLSPKDLVQDTPTVVKNGREGEVWDYLLDKIMPGNVNVEGLGGSAKASIISKAYDGPVNTAETVVCAPGEVKVYAVSDGGMPIAQIKSKAGWHNDYDSLNSATTRIYASEVDVDVPGLYRGNAIWAYAYGNDDNPRVPGEFLLEYLGEPYTGEYYNMTEHGEVVYGDGEEDNATLIIQNYSDRENCPECPPCPDCDLDGPDEPPIGPPAPLGAAPLPALQQIVFEQGGCPALMEWLANEVGVAVDVQVFLANAFVSSTDCQPCETAARLKAAAAVLTDEDGSHMAAMNQVFTELINTLTLSAPFTPEMADSVAAAFNGRVNDGTQYATAIEYIDAFVQYIAILNTEMGSPIADSVAYVLEKYGSDVSGNPIMADFLASRLESGETFAQ